MFTCCTFPGETFRILALITLLLFEAAYVTKKNRRAALVLAAGCFLDLCSAFGVPMLEMVGIYLLGQSFNEGAVAVGMLTVPILQRIAMALHVVCILFGLAMLARDLPDEEHEGTW